MMRALLIGLLSVVCSLATEESWPGVAFTEVRAYAWPNDDSTEKVILEGMALKDGCLNPDGALLTAKQTKSLVAAITGKHQFLPPYRCHIPHNAFVFYGKDGTPVAYVEVCFGCNSLAVAPRGSALHVDFVAMAEIFDTHNLPLGRYKSLASFKKSVEAQFKKKREFDLRHGTPKANEEESMPLPLVDPQDLNPNANKAEMATPNQPPD